MFDLSGAFRRQHYCYNVEAEGAALYFVSCEEILSGSGELVSLGMCDRLLGRAENLTGSGFDLDENQARIGIDHHEIDFTAVAGEIAGEGFVPFCSQELLAAFLTPSPKRFFVGPESAAVKEHRFPRARVKSKIALQQTPKEWRASIRWICYFETVWPLCR